MRAAAQDIVDDISSTNLDSNSNYFTAKIISERPKKNKKTTTFPSQYSLQSRTAPQGSQRYQDPDYYSKSITTASNIDRFSQ